MQRNNKTLSQIARAVSDDFVHRVEALERSSPERVARVHARVLGVMLEELSAHPDVKASPADELPPVANEVPPNSPRLHSRAEDMLDDYDRQLMDGVDSDYARLEQRMTLLRAQQR